MHTPILAQSADTTVMVDLSHVSWETMQDALDTTRAPLVFTHSGANSVNAHPRNVPDHILDQIGEGTGKRDAVMLVILFPIIHLLSSAESSSLAGERCMWCGCTAGRRKDGR